MMISPDGYYEEYLKGKTKEQIIRSIRSLKQEMGHLKNTMENPGFAQGLIMHPSKETLIHLTRKYLEKSKQAYAEVGGTYIASKAEERSTDFDANIDAISRIIFSVGDCFGGNLSYIVELSDELKAYKLWLAAEPIHLINDESQEPFTKETFTVALKELYIGDWRRTYTTKRFGYTVLDGTQWKLEIEYNNGHKTVKITGDNSFPYNFDKVQRLFGIDSTEEDGNE